MHESKKVAFCALVSVCAISLACASASTKTAPVSQAPAEDLATDQAASDRPAPPPVQTSKTGRVEYAPHIVIDWTAGQVEVESRVGLREGTLELLICSEQTKEHESVLVTAARPRQIYEAMGLLGLEPGNPMQYDPQTAQYTPAAGAPLALEIRYAVKDAGKTVAAHEWLAATDSLKAIAPPSWIFCGSRVEEDRYLADGDGTIACVVDFDTALIGMAKRHTASDENLWLVANTPAIPAKDTPCTLVIRALETAPMIVRLTPENYFAYNDNVIDALQLDALIKSRTRHYPAQQVHLSAAENTPNDFARVAGRCIIGSGIARENLVLALNPEEPKEPAAETSSSAGDNN